MVRHLTMGKRLGEASEFTLLGVRLAPQGDLEDHRLEPCLMHLLHLLVRVAFVRQKGPHGRSNRVYEGDHIAQGYVVRSLLRPVGLILLRSGVSERYLLLVVEPLLILWSLAGVENPLPEPLPDSPEVLLVGVSLGVREVAHQVLVGGDEIVLDVQDILGLPPEDLPRHP